MCVLTQVKGNKTCLKPPLLWAGGIASAHTAHPPAHRVSWAGRCGLSCHAKPKTQEGAAQENKVYDERQLKPHCLRTHQTLPWSDMVAAPIPIPGAMPSRG